MKRFSFLILVLLAPCSVLAGAVKDSRELGALSVPEEEVAKLRASLCGEKPVKVLRVVDGDTLIVRLPMWRRLRVRMLGLDAPEMKDKRPAVRKIAKQAKMRLMELVKGGAMIRPKDGYACAFRDKYRRVLAVLLVQENGKWIDAASKLVSEGLACSRRKKRLCDPREENE